MSGEKLIIDRAGDHARFLDVYRGSVLDGVVDTAVRDALHTIGGKPFGIGRCTACGASSIRHASPTRRAS